MCTHACMQIFIKGSGEVEKNLALLYTIVYNESTHTTIYIIRYCLFYYYHSQRTYTHQYTNSIQTGKQINICNKKENMS